MSRSKVLICDLCGTLVQHNTTEMIVQRVSNRSLVEPFPMRLLSRIVFSLGLDLMKSFKIFSINGISEHLLLKEARLYFESVQLRQEVLSILKEKQKQGFYTVLVSGSIEPVVKVFSENLGFDEYCSTVLNYSQKRLNGIAYDMLFNKSKAVKKIAMECNELVVISDNLTDLDLFEMATERYVVINSQKHKKFWEKKLKNFTCIV